MNITLFGANGAIGKLVLEKALEDGSIVTAYVRREDSISIKNKNLKVIVGDLKNSSLIENAIKDSDCVISTLGPHMDMSRKVRETPVSDGHKVIVKAMKKLGKNRLITIGTPTLKADTDQKFFITSFTPYIAKFLFPTGYQEFTNIGEIVKQSDLDWTVVRFLDPKAKHKNQKIDVSLGEKPPKLKISRENIASFIIKAAKENSYIKQMPYVFHA